MKKIFWHLRFWLFFTKCKLGALTGKRDLDPLYWDEQEKTRINYYCKLDAPFSLNESITPFDITLTKSTGYSYDMFRIMEGMDKRIRFAALYGDVIHVPHQPTFVKSRPIAAPNKNSVLLPLDTNRHLVFLTDKHSHQEKISKIVWRGAAYRENRKKFLAAVTGLDFCDVRDTSRNAEGGTKANWLTKEQQLKYKFIFSIEGNDVATNLKWIMSSNSLCFMPKPNYETWFLEGTLIPDYHYVCIKNDFSNIKEKYDFYLANPGKAQEIINHAQQFVNQFRDINRQFELAKEVVSKYQLFISKSDSSSE